MGCAARLDGERRHQAELRDPKFQKNPVRTAEYRQGNLIRDAIRRLIALSDAGNASAARRLPAFHGR